MAIEAAAPLVTLVLSALTSGRWVNAAERVGLTSPDAHKRGVRCVSVGALPAVLSAVVGIFLSTEGDPFVLSASLAAAALGLADDAASLRNAIKIVIPMIFFLPASPQQRAVFGVVLPAWIIWIWAPLVGSYMTNGANLYAGFNGLESGSTVIISLTMAAHAAMAGDAAAVAGFLSVAAAYAAFLPLNWYPARAFPGNVSTFFSGAALAALALSRGMEWPLLVSSIPFLADFSLKVLNWSRARKKGRSRLGPDGRLMPPPHLSVAGLVLRIRPMRERDLVVVLLSLVALCSLLSFLLPPLIHPPA